MSASLSNLVSNLSEGLHNDRCIDCKSYLDYVTTKDDQESCTQLILGVLGVKKIMKKTLIKN